MNKRTLRIIIGIILLLFLVISFVPSFYSSSSSDGLINARTVTLRSPIEGVLHYPRPTKCGVSFKKNEMIGEVVNGRINQGFLYELMTERQTLKSRISVMDKRLAEFSELKLRLKGSLQKYKKFSIRQQDEKIHQIEGRLEQEQAECDRAKSQHDANNKLFTRNVLNKRDYESSEAGYLKSKAKISELNYMLVESKNSLDALRAGIFLGDGHNDVPYSSQRLDQLVIETSLAEAAGTEAKNRIAGIDRQITAEQQRLTKMETFRFSAPFHAVVWRLTEPEGSAIVIDSKLLVLLDCSSVFLDVVLSESQFSDISGGDTIRYRLIGESAYHEGKVFALRGSGADGLDQNLAANSYKDQKREFHVWASIDSNDLDLKPENFYQVGHRVQVKITRKWNIIREFVRFFNVF